VNGDPNHLASIVNITEELCEFDVWNLGWEEGDDTSLIDVQWFAQEATDESQANCRDCDFIYPSSTPIIDFVSPSPTDFYLEATITRCANPDFGNSFALHSHRWFGVEPATPINGYDYSGESIWTGGALTGKNTAPYISIRAGFVTDSAHPNSGGVFAGVGLAGSILLPGTGDTEIWRVGDVYSWVGGSDPDPDTTTGLGGLQDQAPHTLRAEVRGTDLRFFIDGVEYFETEIPLSADQMSTAQGFPGSEDHDDWHNPVTEGFLTQPFGARDTAYQGQVISSGWFTTQDLDEMIVHHAL